MKTARTWAVALTGVDGHMVEVEADISNQTPDFKIIGLPDKSLGEAVQRVHNACKNTALDLPRRRLTVNLSPASLPKQGAGFDLSIAVAALAAGERCRADPSHEWCTSVNSGSTVDSGPFPGCCHPCSLPRVRASTP